MRKPQGARPRTPAEKAAMEEPFDELSKALAEGVSRREAFRRAGGLLLGAVVASLGLDRMAWADESDCRQLCRDFPARELCLNGDCISLTGRRLKACLARCIPLARRNCRADCNTCKHWCTNESGEDSVCFSSCRRECRELCREQLYPAGHERDICVAVCAKCLKSNTQFCGDGSKEKAAHCCQNPEKYCIQDECQDNPCAPSSKPCFLPDGRVGDCCQADEICVDGFCRKCPEGLTFCGVTGSSLACCRTFDPNFPTVPGEMCCSGVTDLQGTVGPVCAEIGYPLPPEQMQCCNASDLSDPLAFTCPAVEWNGKSWKCCRPSPITPNSPPAGWCCPTDTTCGSQGGCLAS